MLEQKAFEDFANKVDWRMECPDEGESVGMNRDGVHTEFGYRPFQDTPHKPCGGTGLILRYPHLFEAVWQKHETPHNTPGECFDGQVIVTERIGPTDYEQYQYTCLVCLGTGYIVRPVMEFWWLAPEALFKTWPKCLIQWQDGICWFTPIYEKDNNRLGPGGFKGEGGSPVLALIEALGKVLD